MAREDQIAREMGVTGVPAMIFGNRLAVSGAREAEVLVSVIDRVTEMAAGNRPRRKMTRTKTKNIGYKNKNS